MTRARPATTWGPVLSGPAVHEVLAAIGEIEQVLTRGWSDDRSTPSVLCERALFFAYQSVALDRADAGDRAGELLEVAALALGSPSSPTATLGELSAIGWTMEHVGHRLEIDVEDVVAAIDDALARRVGAADALGEYDLLGGAAGLALFGLERERHGHHSICLPTALASLVAQAESTASGAVWPTHGRLQVPMPDGMTLPCAHNLGITHGVGGAIGVLTAALAQAPDHEQTRALLSRALSWLVAQQRRCEGSVFPAAITTTGEVRPSTSVAWCYGDAAVGLVALRAGTLLADENARAVAMEAALSATSWTSPLTERSPPSLCHGAAGAGHVFARLFHVTGDQRFADAARRWFLHLIGIHTRSGVEGFRNWNTTTSGQHRQSRSDGLLLGASGIGLALLGAVTDLDPAWDRRLVLSH